MRGERAVGNTKGGPSDLLFCSTCIIAPVACSDAFNICCYLFDFSYELGSGKVHEDGSGAGISAGAGGSTATGALEGEVGRVREDLVKIQEMLLLFSERLAQLEQGAAAAINDPDLQNGVDGTQLLKESRGHAKRRRKDKK